MKAAVVEEPNMLVVRDIPMPPIGDYDALCQLLYGATCTGTDQHIISGRFPFGVEYPTILGHESIGRIIQVGSKVRNYQVGDLVTRVGCPPVQGYHSNWGGFTEYGIARDHWAMKDAGLPRDGWDGYRVNQLLPSDIDPAGACMIITWRETFSYLTRLGIAPSDRVLILGTGGNGLSFAAHARNFGASLVVVTGSIRRENQTRTVGADALVDYKAPALEGLLKDLCPDGFSLIIDSVGKTGQLDRVLPCLACGGRIGIYGVDDYLTYTLSPHLAPGSFLFANPGYDEEEAHSAVIELIQSKKLRAEDFCDPHHPFPLDEIDQAYRAVGARQLVKAVVKLSKS